jgi:hypothetical protein
MCDECLKLETQIRHCKKIVAQYFDPLTTERINALILELQQRKDAMH